MARELTDLLIEHTTRGLAPSDAARLESLRLSDPFAYERERRDVEMSVAALDVCLSDKDQHADSMPLELQQRVSRQAALVVPALRLAQADHSTADQSNAGQREANHSTLGKTLEFPALDKAADRATDALPTAEGSSSVRAPWLLAAAACLLAVFAWLPRVAPPVAETPDATQAGRGDDPSGTVQLAGNPANEATLDLQPSEDPLVAEASGQIVWDAQGQTGVIRLSGVTANDPAEFQYQLWIFDAARDDRYPIDGGVFDIPQGHNTVEIPINAKLSVGQAVLFAITVEPRGGVVVSDRERIVLVAEA